ncbi:MAG: hypothetical protein CSA38_01930 [Flavobacteriales bacterium]|nr:MAG: hypothetical protein CSA38_01930 [Flavobacteriales bacterium]
MKELDFNGVLGNMLHWEVFIIVLIIGLAWIFRSAISDKIKEMSLTKKKRKIENLSHHDFFATTKWVNAEVKRITFSFKGENDEVKSKLLHHLIDLKTNTIEEQFTDFLKNDELNHCSSQDLKQKTKYLLMGIVNTYTSKAMKDFVRIGVSRVDAKFTIDSYEDYRKEIVEAFEDRVDSITTNEDYSCNYDKMNAILEVVAISLYIIPKDVKQAFDKINGRFRKYEHLNLEML